MITFLSEFTSLIFDTLRFDFISVPLIFALFVAFGFIIKNIIRGGES